MPEGNQKQDGMVPLSALLKEKEEAKKLQAQVKELQGKVGALEGQLSVLDDDLKDAEKATDPDKIKLAKAKLLEKHRAIDRRESELKTRETQIAESERKIQAAELAGRYGVPADALLTVDGDMEKEALRLNHELRGSQGNRVYERGEGAPVGQKAVGQMTDEEFAKHYENLQKGAFAKA